MLDVLQKDKLKKYMPWIIFVVQAIVIVAVGFGIQDVWYKVIISFIGLCFNFFTCIGKRWGFLAGALYAITNSAMSFYDQIYASAVFMVAIQLPMAIYTFITWKKSQQSEPKQLKKMGKKFIIATCIAFPLSMTAIYFILDALKSNGPFFDALFFSITLMSCILLAAYYRSAYIFVGLSGFSGIALWGYQAIVNGEGISLLILYIFVFINSLGAIKQQYWHKKTLINPELLEANNEQSIAKKKEIIN